MGFRYIGAKTRVIPEIIKKINSITGGEGHVVDLMCGTGAVSIALRQAGFSVTAVDLMTQSYHHARVQLLLDSQPYFEKVQPYFDDSKIPTTLSPLTPYQMIISYFNHIEPIEGYFFREFSPDGKPENNTKPRKYFSSENAKKIDAVRLFIRQLNEEKAITDLEHSLLIHDLIMGSNDVANIAGTYGHYLSKFVPRALVPIRFKCSNFMINGNIKNHQVLLGYAEEISKNISSDLCYIDPPYMKRQYAANYHILETLARGDEPEAIGVSGLRPWRDQYSNFCSKIKIYDSFEKIFSNMKCSDYLVSYSEDGLLKRNEFEDFFSNFGEVDTSTFPNKRFRSNNSPLDSTVKEYLLHLQIA